jgi:hypothetical protein
MPRRGLIVAALSCTFFVPAPASAKPRRCASVIYEAGGGYYVYEATKIRARHVKCSLARKVARVPPQSIAGSGSEPRRFRRKGFVCRGRRESGGAVPFRCEREKGRGTISFTWTPQ